LVTEQHQITTRVSLVQSSSKEIQFVQRSKRLKNTETHKLKIKCEKSAFTAQVLKGCGPITLN